MTIEELEIAEKEIESQFMENKSASKKDKKSYSSGTETRKDALKDVTDITFKELATEIEKFIPNTEKALKITLAVATSGTKGGEPMLWFLLVGNPSGGKTEIVTLIKRSINTYSVDNLTLSAFISGERENVKGKVHDLLPELNRKCFLIKDWTTLFSLYEEMTSKIIGDLVNIYDGEYTKFSATRGNITYNANFSHIGCITPATLNKHTRYLNMIGPRFLFYIIPKLSKEQKVKGFKSIFSDHKRSKTKDRLINLTSKFLNKLSYLSVKNLKPISEKVELYLRISSEFIAKARGLVVIQASSFKNEEGEMITYYEPLDIQIEEPWRAVQQLLRLSKYLALVEEKDEVGLVELNIIKDVTLSSMPADRAAALNIFRSSQTNEITAKDLADFSEKSPKTARRLLDELVYLGILEKEKGIGPIASTYKLREEFKDYVIMPPSEFLSHYSKNGEPENNIIEVAKEIFK